MYSVSLFPNKKEQIGKNRGGELQCCGITFVMLNPILNLPELIVHKKYLFTKTEDCKGANLDLV